MSLIQNVCGVCDGGGRERARAEVETVTARAEVETVTARAEVEADTMMALSGAGSLPLAPRTPLCVRGGSRGRERLEVPHPEGIIGRKSAGGHGDLPQLQRAAASGPPSPAAEQLWRWLAQLGERRNWHSSMTVLCHAHPQPG